MDRKFTKSREEIRRIVVERTAEALTDVFLAIDRCGKSGLVHGQQSDAAGVTSVAGALYQHFLAEVEGECWVPPSITDVMQYVNQPHRPGHGSSLVPSVGLMEARRVSGGLRVVDDDESRSMTTHDIPGPGPARSFETGIGVGPHVFASARVAGEDDCVLCGHLRGHPIHQSEQDPHP